jgi:drug/metabolite transporter (DMT)-like permease
MMQARNSNGLVLTAFLLIVLFTGFNAIAVKVSETGLPLYFGAAFRFSISAVILFILVLAFHLPLPRGRSLMGAVIFGLLGSGISRALLYYALSHLPSGLAMVLLGLVPLLTFLFACLHRQEVFKWRTLAGIFLAISGIGLIMRDEIRTHLPLLPVLAVIVSAACLAEAIVIIKSIPQSHPVTTNAIALSVGSIFLFILSALSREVPRLPTLATTWASLLYLIVFGTIATFVLTIYVLNHWSATTSSYQYVLFPILAICIGAWMGHESVSPTYILGTLFVLLGVYIGGIVNMPHLRLMYLDLLGRFKARSANC